MCAHFSPPRANSWLSLAIRAIMTACGLVSRKWFCLALSPLRLGLSFSRGPKNSFVAAPASAAGFVRETLNSPVANECDAAQSYDWLNFSRTCVCASTELSGSARDFRENYCFSIPPRRISFSWISNNGGNLSPDILPSRVRFFRIRRRPVRWYLYEMTRKEAVANIWSTMKQKSCRL